VYRLEQHIAEQMHAAQIPGLALAVVQGQEVVYTRLRCDRHRSEDGGLVATPRTLFSIASITIMLMMAPCRP